MESQQWTALAIPSSPLIIIETKTLKELRVEEFWEPTKEDLDRLQVTREIPMVSILLSKEALDSSEPGYQGPVNNTSSKRPAKRKKTNVVMCDESTVKEKK